MNETEKLEIKKILELIPNEFRVIENKINSKVIDEYYKIADSLENENLTEISQSQSTELESLKVLLVYLSEIGDVKSYRKIEEIIKNGKTDILEFSYVALKFARLNLENNLSDEPIGFISTELGGKGNKLRYYFVVKSKDEIQNNNESKIINELKNICIHNDSELEEIENNGKYILVKILISMDYAIGNIIDELTNNCSFLDKEYICNNVEKPKKEFIEKWIDNKLE